MTMSDATVRVGLRAAQKNSAVLPVGGIGLLLLIPASALGMLPMAIAFALYAPVATVVLCRLQPYHPYPSFGAANLVTLLRAGMLAFLASLLVQPDLSDRRAFLVFAISAMILMLDGMDGWLARRLGTVSRFGARFDMEVDALLIMVLAIFAWLEGKAGAWVLLLGAMRYVFVAAGFMFPRLTSDLPPSFRRKAVCVVQIMVLALIALPTVDVQWSMPLALGALLLLCWSFLLDTLWLAKARPDP